MKKSITKLFSIMLLLCSFPLIAEDFKAITDVEVYETPDYGGMYTKILKSKSLHSYKQGDTVKVDFCIESNCKIKTPGDKDAWISEDKISSEIDITKAAENYKKSNMKNWSKTDLFVWEKFRNNLSMIDSCALKLAHKIKFNPSSDWPAYCNTFRNTKKVLDRTKEIESITQELNLSNEDYSSVKKGEIWINAPEKVVIISWGTPDKKHQTINAKGKNEQWIYSNGYYVYIDNGKITSIHK
ncbi:MAG: hypothetical protein IMY67_04195 [Bacteroidetes bacterium]|nr:hypothetical protein [Bacteroidota bacterium]